MIDDDDDMYVLKAHANQLQTDLEKINYELEDIHPKPKVQVLQWFEDITATIFAKEKTARQIDLEKRKDEIIKKLKDIRQRIEILEKGI